MTIESHQFRQVLGHYPTGVCVVTAADENGDLAAMVVGSFTSVSLDPPLVAFFPDRKSMSWPRIRATGKFCVNVLADDQKDLCLRISSSSADKFDQLRYRASPNGSWILDDVVAWCDCDLESVQGAGDHFIALGRVRDLAVENAGPPLLFYQGGFGSFSSLR